MKALFFVTLFTLSSSFCFSQNKLTDSLKNELAISLHDTARVLILSELSDKYRRTKLGTSIKYGQQALELAKKINFPKGEASALCNIGYGFRESGDLPKALDFAFKALKIAEKYQLSEIAGESYNLFGVIYFDLYDYKKSIYYYQQAIKFSGKSNNKLSLISEFSSISAAYIRSNQLDSSRYYIQLAYDGSIKSNYTERLTTIFRVYGWIEKFSGNDQLALNYFKKGVQEAYKFNSYRDAAFNYNEIANLFQEKAQPDSSIFYAKKGLANAQLGPYKIRILESSTLLAEAYKQKKDFKQAFEYQALMVKTKESLYSAGNIQAMQTMIADDEARRKEVEVEKRAYQNQLKQYGLLTSLAIMFLIGFILYRNNRQKQKANQVLGNTLSTLKATQAQLFQSEKLASLGELTAGIAHEIQNPLNFVNNFSEVSAELVTEMNEELDKEDIKEAKEIANDLKQNLEKINLHGKRASSIVKGMLEHSRTSTGVKEPTDINALAYEYLRLSYHGIKAKDNSFESDYQTDFDTTLPNIEVIPLDMGRVLLNLMNNAFWAVNERSKKGDTGYEPNVTVSTQLKADSRLLIAIKDNGIGMTNEIKAKVFQPFFTTKPTGQGTGLGLSLAYDIVTKGHGGALEIETKVGEGSVFNVKLPIKTI